MKPEEFTRYDGLGLAEVVHRGEASATEVLDTAIAQIEAGVPYLLKDLGAHYTGAVTYGSSLFKDFVADHDSEGLLFRLGAQPWFDSRPPAGRRV